LGRFRELGEELAARANDLPTDPFALPDEVVSAAADRAGWQAETLGLLGADDADAWKKAAKAWEALGRPHRAAYALWRQAEALLVGREHRAASDALSRGHRLATGFVPLLREMEALGRRARLDLHEQPVARVTQQRTPEPALTERELDVLRLLLEGKTNADIGAALYMSPKTASVHVTHIMQKLNATNRVQAAARAQRLGLVDLDARDASRSQ
jgi:DNA-binding CsgD family transcriptional regulator